MENSYRSKQDETLSRKLRAVSFAILAAGTLARVAFVAHPTDARSMASWREADYTQVARSFFREGMNPLYPRIDWRADTPGYVEMELPILPWTAALAYRLAGSVGRAVRISWKRDHQPLLEEMYRCSRELGAEMPGEGQIVVRGGRRFDGHGHPVAYNESMIFTWMDRKGINYAMEDSSLETVEEMARRGADYWVAKPADLEDETVRAEAERRWALIARCDGYSLYDLASTGQRGAGE